MLIRELAERLAGTMMPVVAGIGPRSGELRSGVSRRIPWLDYEEFGPNIDRNLAAVIWFAAPLIGLSLLLWARYSPRIWLGNGLLSAALGIVPQKISEGRVVVSYNAYMSEDKPGRRRMAKWIARHVDLVLVNSEGSLVDAETFAPRERIRILPLCADNIFFTDGEPAPSRLEWGVGDGLVVAFVGRLDREKHCGFLLQVAALCPPGGIRFVFAGHGPMKDAVEAFAAGHPNVLYLGRILDREKLRDLYQAADIVWSYADETYLAKPAVEALASGVPILIPDRPAILAKAERRATIDPKLVPDGIGWIVDSEDAKSVAQLLIALGRDRDRLARMRPDCRAYARRHYSSETGDVAVRAILSLLDGASPRTRIP